MDKNLYIEISYGILEMLRYGSFCFLPIVGARIPTNEDVTVNRMGFDRVKCIS